MIDIPVIICRRCNLPKIPFQLRKQSGKHSLHRICKPCSSAQAQQWAKSHPEQRRIVGQKYHAKHRNKLLARGAAYYKKNREIILEKSREYGRKYPWTNLAQHRGLFTIKEFNKFMHIQNGLCAICHSPPNKRSLNMDHDHATGRKRGLLCQYCNHALGQFGDDPELMRRAILYLERI